MRWLNLFLVAVFFGSALSYGQSSNVCRIEAYQAKESVNSLDRREHRARLMHLALCYHTRNLLPDALNVYQELRRVHADYAFPLVNIAHVHVTNGEHFKAIDALSLYFTEVGGYHGEGVTGLADYDSILIGSPCLEKALHREDCVSALNIYGISLHHTYGKEQDGVPVPV